MSISRSNVYQYSVPLQSTSFHSALHILLPLHLTSVKWTPWPSRNPPQADLFHSRIRHIAGASAALTSVSCCL